MDAQNKFLLEKIRIMAKQVEDNLIKKEQKQEEKNKKFIKQPAGQRVNRMNNSNITWRNSLRRPW
tara:strand:+ start:89 stop:283 length:195 start_codon:yes stop_codon:yes gene_type:complete